MASRPQARKIRQNLSIGGRRTSLSLEAAVWETLTEICRIEEKSLDELCDSIVRDAAGRVSMASALRLRALGYFREAGAASPSGG